MSPVDPTVGHPVPADVFRVEPEPTLFGSRCGSCGCVTFPHQDGCPRCTKEGMVREALPRRGRLWTWTVQGFPPKSPPYSPDAPPFEPFGVGYVELGDVRVEGRLVEHRPANLHIGMEMEVVPLPFAGGVTYAFAATDREESGR